MPLHTLQICLHIFCRTMKYHISLLQEWSLWCLSEHNGNSWTSNLISCKCHQTLNQALENFKAVGVGNSRFTKRGHIIVTLRLEKGLSLVMVTAPRDSISAARNSLLLQLHHPILNCRVLKDWKKLWRGTSVQPHSNIPSCGSPPPSHDSAGNRQRTMSVRNERVHA